MEIGIRSVVDGVAGARNIGASIKSPMRLGQGFGISAAVSIALAASAPAKKSIPVTIRRIGL